MKILIDIPEETYKGVLEEWEIEKDSRFTNIIHKAIVYSQPHEDRPTGHWVQRICNFYWYKQFACSECGHEIICHEKTPNFCEKCGADMRGGVINE